SPGPSPTQSPGGGRSRARRRIHRSVTGAQDEDGHRPRCPKPWKGAGVRSRLVGLVAGRGTLVITMTDPPARRAPDHASDILRVGRHPLDAFFRPSSVAVIGATEQEGSVGRTLVWNLISSPFGGTVFPVNPRRTSVLGIKAYPSLAEVPEPVELAIVVTP